MLHKSHIPLKVNTLQIGVWRKHQRRDCPDLPFSSSVELHNEWFSVYRMYDNVWVYMSNICLLLTVFVCDSKIGRDFSREILQKCDRQEADWRFCYIVIMTFGLQSSWLCYLWAVWQQHASHLRTFQEGSISLSLHCNSQLVFQIIFVLKPDVEIIHNAANYCLIWWKFVGMLFPR